MFWGDFLSIASELLRNNYTGGSGFYCTVHECAKDIEQILQSLSPQINSPQIINHAL